MPGSGNSSRPRHQAGAEGAGRDEEAGRPPRDGGHHAGEFAEQVRASVVDDQAKVFVIDSLTGYNTMADITMLPLQMHELLTFLSCNGVLTILIVARAGIMSVGSVKPVDLSCAFARERSRSQPSR